MPFQNRPLETASIQIGAVKPGCIKVQIKGWNETGTMQATRTLWAPKRSIARPQQSWPPTPTAVTSMVCRPRVA